MPDSEQSTSNETDIPNAESAAFAESLEQAEERLWRQHRLIWWTTLVGPLLVTVAILSGVYVIAGSEYTTRLLTTAMTGVLLFGRFIILGGHDPEVASVTAVSHQGSCSWWSHISI